MGLLSIDGHVIAAPQNPAKREDEKRSNDVHKLHEERQILEAVQKYSETVCRLFNGNHLEAVARQQRPHASSIEAD